MGSLNLISMFQIIRNKSAEIQIHIRSEPISLKFKAEKVLFLVENGIGIIETPIKKYILANVEKLIFFLNDGSILTWQKI